MLRKPREIFQGIFSSFIHFKELKVVLKKTGWGWENGGAEDSGGANKNCPAAGRVPLRPEAGPLCSAVCAQWFGA